MVISGHKFTNHICAENYRKFQFVKSNNGFNGLTICLYKTMEQLQLLFCFFPEKSGPFFSGCFSLNWWVMFHSSFLSFWVTFYCVESTPVESNKKTHNGLGEWKKWGAFWQKNMGWTLKTLEITVWPLAGNEGMKPYMVMMGIHSLIPYKGPARLAWYPWFWDHFKFGNGTLGLWNSWQMHPLKRSKMYHATVFTWVWSKLFVHFERMAAKPPPK